MTIQPSQDFPLPQNLPRPIDDGAARHLAGMAVPPLLLPSTAGDFVNLSRLSAKQIVVYCYPRTGVPGTALPEGWDAIPGARGCTPESCCFRDRYRELLDLGVSVFGLSTQTTEYQREMANRLRLPFPVLSDSEFRFSDALRLPTFEVQGMRLLKRLTLVIRNGRIDHVFYPVFPPDQHASEVLRWLAAHPNPNEATP
jgi:peroxiredoxin